MELKDPFTTPEDWQGPVFIVVGAGQQWRVVTITHQNDQFVLWIYGQAGDPSRCLPSEAATKHLNENIWAETKKKLGSESLIWQLF